MKDNKMLYTIIAVVFGFLVLVWLMFSSNNNYRDKYTDKILESQKRELILQHELEKQKEEYAKLEAKGDSISTVIEKQKETIIVINKKYKDLKDKVRNLTDDESIDFLREKLK